MNTGFVSRFPRVLVWPALLLVWLACRFEARANPTGGSVSQGHATISGMGSSTVNINQVSSGAWINWNTFNVGLGETVNFNQPSANSVTWNQINDANPSQILGDINANGYVVLQNASGFFIGGQAVLTTHGLVMTTASTPVVNLANGGPWSFDTPPPAARIENFGRINITGGGTAFLIAADILNGGSITAPNGHIGLYDGETVLVSTSPNGQGLNAEVTLPQGSVDNEGKLTANGGSVVAQAQFVNQNGVIQADTAQNVNGTIELLGGSAVALGSHSAISARGDAQGVSSGGSVTIRAGNIYSDQAGSTISVAGGAQGGNGGSVDICAPQTGIINTMINGQALDGFTGGTLTLDPADIWLASSSVDPSAPAGYSVVNVNNYNGLSQISIQADDDIVLNTLWQLTGQASPATLDLTAGNDITLNANSGISAGQNWNINFQAGHNITMDSQSTLSVGGGIPGSVSLQAGNEIALNSGSEIEADGGNINLNAATLDLAGTLQANSVGSLNGVIDVEAQNLTLENNSIINANGDSSPGAPPSPGGFVVLNAQNSYVDYPGSSISVSGNAAGGQGGVLEVLCPASASINSQVASGSLAELINPQDIYISENPTTPSTQAAGGSYPNPYANFYAGDLAGYSQIDLRAPNNIELSAVLGLNTATVPTALSLTAGNNITLDTGSGIDAGQNWTVNLTAGTGLAPGVTPASGSDGIYLEASGTAQSYILGLNGNINLRAANEVQVGWVNYAGSGVETPSPGSVNPGASSVSTAQGGSINVTTLYGDVNTGSDPNGFNYSATGYSVPDNVSTLLGGISTAAGGNVNINAGGNVISYIPASGSGLPAGSVIAQDGGTGAFGSQAGNVTITAGDNVYGHFVLANGVGTITAGQNIGLAANADFALSLISGGWSVNAPNGSIYLQEVRNPNGVFNDSGPHGRSGNPAKYLFNYSPDAYVDLTANGVYLTDLNLPRYSAADIAGVLYPPILAINAGSGGVTLEGPVTLFPSADQNLDITTTDGGSLTYNGSTALPFSILMSDSAQVQWQSSLTFGYEDHGSLANEPGESSPVAINISGSMVDFNLMVDKVADISVGQNMINCSFSGQNLQANDITSITVGGFIYNASPYSWVDLSALIPEIPDQDLQDLLPGMADSWNAIFALAIDASQLNTSSELQALQSTPVSDWLTAILENPEISLFQDQKAGNSAVLTPSLVPAFIYTPSSSKLWYVGQMPQQIEQDLEGPITVLHLVNGQPVIDNNPGDDSPGRTYRQVETDTINWLPASEIQTLYGNSQGAPQLSSQLGYRIGGPGQFDITANSISLGASDGIIASGIYDPQGYSWYGNLASITPVSATINILVTGNQVLYDPLPGETEGEYNPYESSLYMISSTIASLEGGGVNVLNTGGGMDLGNADLINSTVGGSMAFGIYTTAGGNVNVIALDDVDIDGSRIATYDGGDILVESETKDVNVGNGSSDINSIVLVYNNEAVQDPYSEDAFGSGIQAKTPVPPTKGEAFPSGTAAIPGNIIVEAWQGNIIATTAGIIQEALDGSIAPGPYVTLDAGTFPAGTPGQAGYTPGYPGNIDLGDSGVIGGTVNLSANGNIIGEIISRQNSTVNAAQSFSGTLLAGGAADVSGGGTVSGTIVGVGGANVTGGNGVTASVLGQNVSVNGGASQSTLGTATATTATQSAAQQSSSQAQQQVTADQGTQDDEKKKKKTPIRKEGHVTVLLSAAVPK